MIKKIYIAVIHISVVKCYDLKFTVYKIVLSLILIP